MKLSFIRPNLELKPYIESLWVFESENGLPNADHSMPAPNGCPKPTFRTLSKQEGMREVGSTFWKFLVSNLGMAHERSSAGKTLVPEEAKKN